MSSDKRHQLVFFGVAMSLVGIVTLWVLYLIRGVLLLVYISGLLAVGFSPVVRWLERRHMAGRQRRRVPRTAAILLLYLGLIALVAGILSVVLPPLVRQTQALWGNLPQYADLVQATLDRYGLVNAEWTWSEFVKTLPNPTLAVGEVLGALQGAIGVVGGVVTVLVLPFYLLTESKALQAGFLKLFRADRRTQVANVTQDVTVKVGAWLGGQFLLAFMIGTTAAIGLWLLGVPYFYVLALLAGVGEMIPVIGPILAAIPAVLVGFTVSVHTGLFVALYFSVQQFIENHFLVPRLMQRQVGVSASTVIVALLIGTELLGVVGALLAVPSAAIAQVLLQVYLDRDEV
jgi:predicted PurR-regulated permease PerM